ncbi:hypothetical protein SD70_02355 [Gordoniibacillus kamchatkensis]|uniref:HTH LytTR-type domain-containing protein n=1 Tax=Gordoniibacillus kamchatkensis TaxID=1590651 RepID=A0ABR5AMI7_9BACL|nr:LytTR family transcriptional regulator DNA-binding domain-containing protein [Paenibacillus sp. VKM B-2647]KIL42048.1 hypothetical protein SD70_02355 [Paenibacillus sp. VKM B-2647]
MDQTERLSVVRRLANGTDQLVNVPISDIRGIKTYNSVVTVHMKDGEVLYVPDYSIDGYFSLLKPYHFEKLDRNNLANMEEAAVYDGDAKRLYFEESFDKDSFYVTVSEPNIPKVKHLNNKSATAPETKKTKPRNRLVY